MREIKRGEKIGNLTVVYPSLNFVLCVDENGNKVRICYTKYKMLKNGNKDTD